MELLQKKPGIVGLIAQEDVPLWDIAKQYHTTKDALMEMNQLTDHVLRKGQKIMIVKNV
jgi:LysM repeat protein